MFGSLALFGVKCSAWCPPARGLPRQASFSEGRLDVAELRLADSQGLSWRQWQRTFPITDVVSNSEASPSTRQKYAPQRFLWPSTNGPPRVWEHKIGWFHGRLIVGCQRNAVAEVQFSDSRGRSMPQSTRADVKPRQLNRKRSLAFSSALSYTSRKDLHSQRLA